MPAALLYAAAALAGLVLGSFLNVVIHRLPRGRSTVKPRSGCPYCLAPLKARDNVPILSFLLLRGRCRACSAPISWRYPVVEGLTAVLYVACAARFGATPEALIAALFCTLMLVLAAIDAEHFLLPDKLTLPGIVAGVALQPWLPRTTVLDSLLGVLGGAGALILLINYWYWIRGEEGMGLGDVNMLAMIGAFLGWQGAILSLVAAALVGALTGILLLVGGRAGMGSRLPFGVFLAGGALIALFLGPQVLEIYRGWL